MNSATSIARFTPKTTCHRWSSHCASRWSWRRRLSRRTGSVSRVRIFRPSTMSSSLSRAVSRRTASIRIRWRTIAALSSTSASASQASAPSRWANESSTSGGRRSRRLTLRAKCLSSIWRTRSIARSKSTRSALNVHRAWRVATFGDVPSNKCCFSRKLQTHSAKCFSIKFHINPCSLPNGQNASVVTGGGFFSHSKFRYSGRTEREILSESLQSLRQQNSEASSPTKRKASSVPATPSSPQDLIDLRKFSNLWFSCFWSFYFATWKVLIFVTSSFIFSIQFHLLLWFLRLADLLDFRIAFF